jgi:serine/threonine-protein kinase
MRPQVGQVINNKYRLLRLIGDGGMGSVYEARHEVLGMSVALKFLHPELSRRQGLVQRFLQEAKVSAKIHSPHVVRVTDVDQIAGGQAAFIVLEYLEGRTLQTLYEDLYREGQQLSYADALEYAMQMLEGVEAAHRAGIVHRDLKPDNVMITKGPKGAPLLKLLDFGIAKLKVTGELDRGLTRPGVIMGTPEYMAPEQAYSADAVDARADIFSLGVMIFEMLAGRRPVGGDDPQQIASAYISGQVARLGELCPGIAPALAAAVHTAMAPLPKDRFASVVEFRDALEPFARSVRAPMHSHPSNPGVTPTPAAVTPHTPASAGRSPIGAPVDTNAPTAAFAAVPKTLPPEGDAHPGALGPSTGATPLGGLGAPGTPPWGGSGVSRAPVSNAQSFAATSLALNEQLVPPYPPNGGKTNFASPLELSPRPSGTAIASAGYGGGMGSPAAGGTAIGGPGTAPMAQYVPHPVTAPATPEPRRKAQQGPPVLLILLLATGIAGLVVGGIYAANRYADVKDGSDQPITPPPTATVASDPPLPSPERPAERPAERPTGAPPITAAKPPPIANNPKGPPPKSSGPAAQPSSQPGGQPPILPSTFPPWVVPSEFPQSVPLPMPPLTSPPGGATSPPGGATPPPSTPTGRPGVIIRPRH